MAEQTDSQIRDYRALKGKEPVEGTSSRPISNGSKRKIRNHGRKHREFIYGLRVRKHPQPQTKAKEGTKRHLNLDRSWSPRNKLCKWPSTRKKKSDPTFKIARAMKTEAQGPIFTPLETAEIPKLDDTLS